jgi:hypothetical protein
MNYFVFVRKQVYGSCGVFSVSYLYTSYYSLVRNRREKDKGEGRPIPLPKQTLTKERINSSSAASHCVHAAYARHLRRTNYEVIRPTCRAVVVGGLAPRRLP